MKTEKTISSQFKFRNMTRILYIIILCCLIRPLWAATIYVDLNATGANNGSSWTDAYTNLSDAIFNSTVGDDIWVAQGSYTPDRNSISGTPGVPSNRTNSFFMRNGVAVYGGFQGNETLLTERNFFNNVTILDGEIGTAAITDNCYNVVRYEDTYTTTTVISGFTIQNGYGTDAAINASRYYEGAGLVFVSDPGMDLISVLNCTFQNNNSYVGAAFACEVGPSAYEVNDCIIQNNTANQGGAAYLRNHTCNIRRCVFLNNSAVAPFGYGGALRTEGILGCIVENSIFANNNSVEGGAWWGSFSAISKFANCTFYNNSASIGSGGAMNKVTAAGGYLTNCILRNNGATPIANTTGPITYCLVSGDGAVAPAGVGNIGGDPLLVNPSSAIGFDGLWGTLDDGFRLNACSSPAVDAGTASDAPTNDLIGIARPLNAAYDIGAYENNGDINTEVDIKGNGSSITIGDNSPSTTDDTNFGRTCLGGSISHTFTISNSGTAPLDVSAIFLSGSNAGQFTVSGITLPTVIAASSSTTFTLTYNPASTGIEAATVTVYNTDCDEGFYDFSVEGEGAFFISDIIRDQALNFNGTNGNVSIVDNSSLDLTNNLTLETWVHLDAMPSSLAGLISKYDVDGANRAYFLGVQNDGSLTVSLSSTGTLGSTTTITTTAGDLTTDQWYHIAVTHDAAGSNNTKIYINGILIQQNNNSSSIFNSAANLYLGGYDNSGNGLNGGANLSFLDGQMDEVRIWNTTRTAAEIRENLHLTLSGCEAGLVTYYQMNDGNPATTLTDRANSNTGTLINMTPVTDWTNSGVNIGNDASTNSNSQTITAVPFGTSTQTFATANLEMRFFAHSGTEDITVTYQEFTPNTITGIDGFNIIQNPMWTVNKSSITETMLVDYTFTFPVTTFTSLDPTKYALFWRAMYDDGAWTKIATAHSVTSTTVSFGKISLTGQFMVVQESDALVSDVRGNMYDFDGSDDYIEIPDNAALDITGQITLEAWVYKTSNVSWDMIIDKRLNNNSVANYGLGTNGGHPIFYHWGAGGNIYTAPSPISLNEWHHLAAVHDGSNIILYVDGVEVFTTPTTNSLITTNEPLSIGSRRSGGEHHHGKLDEIRIWNVARSQEDIRENMHLTLKGNETGLAAYYQFNNDEAVSTTNGVKDALGINNGTTQNMIAADYQESEVAVAGGTSDRVTILSSGVESFPNTGVDIDFGATHPNGEIVIYRLETEKPHGWESISGDVDDEYFVVRNFGVTTFDPLNDITFNRLSYVSPLDVGVAQAASPLQLYKRDDNAFGATWGTSFGGADNATAGSNAMISFNATNNLTSFSQIALVNNGMNSGLPVELLAFTAKRITVDQVRLDWATASELNNKGFYIERMLEVEGTFEIVGFVEGIGTTTQTTNYQFIDENSYTGVSYYRLKQVDLDGTTTYSEIRAVVGTGNNNQNTSYIDLSIYPNPVYKELNVRFNKLPKKVKSATVKIMAANGQVVHVFQAGIQSYQVLNIEAVEALTPAMYMLSIELNNGKRIVQKFIKQ